jgi:hypothetical protein
MQRGATLTAWCYCLCCGLLLLLLLLLQFETIQLIAKRGITLSNQQFRDRIDALQHITGAYSPEQQRKLPVKLWHYPSLLKLPASTLLSRADKLLKQLQQRLGVSPALVQQLIMAQPVLLQQHADAIADKVEAVGQRLGIRQHKDVLALWMRSEGYRLINMSIAQLDRLLEELAAKKGLSAHYMGLVAAQWPGLLYCGTARAAFVQVGLLIVSMLLLLLMNAHTLSSCTGYSLPKCVVPQRCTSHQCTHALHRFCRSMLSGN